MLVEAKLLPDSAVSTHSRPKAAGQTNRPPRIPDNGFNTQPPEGGWLQTFNAQGLAQVSTHSRPKAAGHCPNRR